MCRRESCDGISNNLPDGDGPNEIRSGDNDVYYSNNLNDGLQLAEFIPILFHQSYIVTTKTATAGAKECERVK